MRVIVDTNIMLDAGVDSIVIRNTKDFAGSALKVFEPSEFLAQFNR